jgi:hypothetical protein
MKGRPAVSREAVADQQRVGGDPASVMVFAAAGLAWAIWKVWVWQQKRRDDESPSVETD